MVGDDITKSDVSSERRHRISQSAYHLSQPDDLEIDAERRECALRSGRASITLGEQAHQVAELGSPEGSVRRIPSRPAVVRPLNPTPARSAQSGSLIAPGSAGR